MVWRTLILFLLFLHYLTLIHSQDPESVVSSIISTSLEGNAGSESSEEDPEEIVQDLYDLIDTPLNLNSADETSLKCLHFLNDFHICLLLKYREQYGPFMSYGELNAIDGFNDEVIRKLQKFTYISNDMQSENVSQRRSHLRQQLVFRYRKDLALKKGFIPDSVTLITPFAGHNRSLMSRYQIKSGNMWMAGITFEQDPGESFRSGNSSFKPDFTSAFIETVPKRIIDHIILGDFRVSYAQGLVLSGYSQRKGTGVILRPGHTGIRKYSSTGENEFYRGLALSAGPRKLKLDLFFSGLNRDASMYTDSVPYFRSLSSAGLHRTESELERKDAVLHSCAGTHCGIKISFIDLGFTYFGQKFNSDYIFTVNPFNSERIRKGDIISNFSFDYKLNMGKCLLSGEYARDYRGEKAFLSSMIVQLHPLVQLSFVFRRYDPFYFGTKSHGFGERSNTRDENGSYLGLEIYPFRPIKLEIFADRYRFPFPDYSMGSPGRGNEYFLKSTISCGDSLDLIFQTRYVKNQKETEGSGIEIPYPGTKQKINYRFEFQAAVMPGIEIRSRTEMSYCNETGKRWSKGYYSGNDIGLRLSSAATKFWFRFALFDIPGFDNRIYAYENDVLYGYSVPVFNSRGSRTVLLLRISCRKRADIWFRYAATLYRGIKITGSGMDQVKSDKDQDFAVQFQIKI